MYRSTQGPEPDVQGGWVKLHEGILKDNKRKGQREKKHFLENGQHMQIQDNLAPSGKITSHLA